MKPSDRNRLRLREPEIKHRLKLRLRKKLKFWRREDKERKLPLRPRGSGRRKRPKGNVKERKSRPSLREKGRNRLLSNRKLKNSEKPLWPNKRQRLRH